MKVLRVIVPIALGGLIVFFYANARFAAFQRGRELDEVRLVKGLIERQIHTEAGRIVRQLGGFSRIVSADREFAQRLFVDKDRSAPEVSEMAQKYMEAMDFSLLELADSSLTIVSCGQFPAASGNTIKPSAALLDTEAVFLFDDIRGEKIFSLQARVRFSIDEFTLHSIGGITIDTAFLSHLRPHQAVRLIIKQGQFVIGTDKVESMSDFKDNSLVVNDTAYTAESLSLPYAGKGDAPVLYILMPKVKTASLLSAR